MKITLLDKAKKKKIISEVADLGLKKIPQLLIKTGAERIRAFSGSLSKEEIMEIWRIVPLEGIGLYVGKERIDRRTGAREVRLSLDGLHTWKEQIDGNILQLNEKQEDLWFAGENIELSEEQKKKFENVRGFVSVRSSDNKDFIGTGKIGNDRKILFGFLPKERRRKSSVIN